MKEPYGHAKAGIIKSIHTMYVYFYNNNDNDNNNSLKIKKVERAERCDGENQEELL